MRENVGWKGRKSMEFVMKFVANVISKECKLSWKCNYAIQTMDLLEKAIKVENFEAWN